MTKPSKKRIAAALALADAADTYWADTECQPGWVKESTDMYNAVHAYRATAPKLRTRAERDAELNRVSSHMAALLFGPGRGHLSWGATPGEPHNFRADTDINKLMRLRDRWEELRAEPVTDDAPEPICTVHGNVEHGREAEELRSGIEEFIRQGAVVSGFTLQRLLDSVDARDSLAFSERAAELTEARAKIAELERTAEHLNELRLDAANRAHVAVDRAEAAEAKVKELERNQVTPAMLAEFESGKQQRDELRAKVEELEASIEKAMTTRRVIEQALNEQRAANATLRADNERFARELLEARKPCERRHLTEAEEALCHYVDTRVVPWDTHTYGGFADYLNAVRNERRQQTKTKGDAEAAAMRSEEHRAPASAASPAEPEPERCSCEELRNAVKLALGLLNDCDLYPGGSVDIAREALRKALS